MATPPVFLPGEAHEQRSLVGSPREHRVRHNLATKQQLYKLYFELINYSREFILVLNNSGSFFWNIYNFITGGSGDYKSA